MLGCRKNAKGVNCCTSLSLTRSYTYIVKVEDPVTKNI